MASVLTKMIDRVKHEEGCIPHMYLDTRGFVTVGVGHMIPNSSAAAKLPFVHRDTQQAVTTHEIINEYNAVKSKPIGLVASAYKAHSSMILLDKDIDQILEEQLLNFSRDLQKDLSDFDSFPEEAQHALLDMAFNLGSNGLLTKFPKLIGFAKQKNWENCANECRRGGIGDARNEMTKALFMSATRYT